MNLYPNIPKHNNYSPEGGNHVKIRLALTVPSGTTSRDTLTGADGNPSTVYKKELKLRILK